MKTSFIATAAFAASASALGSAVVKNSCDYDVYLYAVPASGGGYTEITETLSSGDSWTQEWTELTNDDGWSIKLSNTTSLTDGIMQYEYTYQDAATIWYDLSDVNGNPWDGDWEITSNTDTCTPKQQAYRYSTDDAYGMQACPATATITVTLCSGDSSDDSAASSASASVASETATATESVTTTLSTITAGTVTSTISASTATEDSSSTVTEQATTLATSVFYVTEIATTTLYTHGGHGGNDKRDAHIHKHARHFHGQHA